MTQIQDVINFEPAPVRVIENDAALKLLENPAYYMILDILYKRPMTIREVEQAYATKAKRNAECSKKSYNTIYRYMNTLQDAGLIIPAGKRMSPRKTATETLFARTAKVFLYTGFSCKKHTEQEISLLTRIRKGMGATVADMTDGLDQCVHLLVEGIVDTIRILVETLNKDTLYAIIKNDWEEGCRALEYLALLTFVTEKSQILDNPLFRDSSSAQRIRRMIVDIGKMMMEKKDGAPAGI